MTNKKPVTVSVTDAERERINEVLSLMGENMVTATVKLTEERIEELRVKEPWQFIGEPFANRGGEKTNGWNIALTVEDRAALDDLRLREGRSFIGQILFMFDKKRAEVGE